MTHPLAALAHLCGICWQPCETTTDEAGALHVRCTHGCPFAIVIEPRP